MYVRSVFNNAVQGCQKGIVEMKEMHKQRNSNIELLRIIAMFMIIASHYPHGLSGTDLGYGANRYFYSIFTAFGQVGVGIFLLIMPLLTAIFCASKRIAPSKGCRPSISKDRIP